MTAIAPGAVVNGQCCGTTALTPLAIANRPGLSTLAYRVGTQPQFKDSMLARLARVSGLQTRADDDFSIALIDAWACVADTLTFYQERVANECYLRTAAERRSLVELGRLIDYRARPGVAAGAYLAFAVEDAPGAPELAAQPVSIGVGLKVQSVPAPGELPQTFETVEAIEARPEWNAIRPRLTQDQPVATAMQTVSVNGASTGLKPGDSLLIVVGENDEDRTLKRIVKVTADAKAGTTRIDLVADPPDPPPFVFPPLPAWEFQPFRYTLSRSFVANNILGAAWRQADLFAFAGMQRWPLRALSRHITWQVKHPVFPADIGIFAFRHRAAIFGHNAARGTGQPGSATNWDDPPRKLEDDGASEIHLDRTYPDIIAGSWLVLESPTDRKVYRVDDNAEISRADFGLSAKVSRVRLSSDAGFDTFKVRETTVLAGSGRLDLAGLPIVDVVEGAGVTLDGVYLGLDAGRTVIVTGTRADLEGVVDSEVMTLAAVDIIGGFTSLVFQRALANRYVRDTVTINANVAAATHGETVQDVLGAGNASEVHQRFALAQQPLTYVSSDGPTGGASTLRVRVNDLLWQEAPSFHGRSPDARVFVTHVTEQGTTVEFGDGLNGARVPTGADNIRATYRKGIGTAGNVDATQLTLLLSRPPGVRSVTNSLPASGGTDPEPADSIRRNAPVTVRTMDRIVSLQDYEDFARAFSGIGKALATPWIFGGHARGVFLTVAGPAGADLPVDGPIYGNLLAAIQKAGGPHVPVRVESCRKAFFQLAATVMVAPEAKPELVVAAVEAALRARFSFDARAFGQAVNLAEAMAAIQGVPGVIAVDIDVLQRTDTIGGDGLVQALPAAGPEPADDGSLLGAELLMLDPRPVALKGVTA
jgi:predicted phage baseplate assembly protein